MPFPNLALRTDVNAPNGVSLHYAEVTGVPDNGDNTFDLPFVGAGIDPTLIDVQGDWLEIDADPLGPSVTGVTEGSPLMNAARTQMTLNFDQSGADSCRVRVRLIHSSVR